MASLQLYDVLQALQAIIYGGLGAIAFLQWRRRGGESAAWLAATFGSLAIVVILGEVVPEDAPNNFLLDSIQKLTLVLVVLFPYLLYRFATTFFEAARWFSVLATTLTAAALAGGLVLELPDQGEPRSTVVVIYIYLVVVQWVLLSGRVAVRLWKASGGQPTVSSRRLRTLSVGSFALAFAVVIAAAASPTERPHAAQFLVQFIALVSGPLFLLGFAPPGFVRSSWRLREVVKLREAEVRLLSAEDGAAVADILLPRVTHLLGGHGSALLDREGNVLGVHGLNPDSDLRPETDGQTSDAKRGALRMVAVPLESGKLLVQPSAYAPFFGDEEFSILEGLATVTDLALARANLLQRERRTAAELRAANEAMRDFVAIASHDLRTPLTVIRGFCIALEQQWKKVGDAEKLEYLSMMDRQAEHLARLVDDLLTVSQIDARALEAQKERIEIRSAIDRALEGLDTEISVEATHGLAAVADPHHVHRMIRNYLENAISYGGPPVMVEARPNDGWIEVMVRDQGEGVDNQFTEKLFDKFARAQAGAAMAKQGTGLGLSIVAGLAQANGGEVWYEPNVPRGSCFGIRLPQARA
jgi:signal transduction histidine kinase